METLCHCGKPLHYSDPKLQEFIQTQVNLLGEYIVVAVGDKKWKVQRHYIALHGLKAYNITRLGFEQLTETTGPSTTPGSSLRKGLSSTKRPRTW